MDRKRPAIALMAMLIVLSGTQTLTTGTAFARPPVEPPCGDCSENPGGGGGGGSTTPPAGSPMVRVALDTITSWRTQEGGDGDEIFIKIIGPWPTASSSQTVRAWPSGGSVMPVRANSCYSPNQIPCPPGSNSYPAWATPSSIKPSFVAQGGQATIEIWEVDSLAPDDLIARHHIRLDPLTTSVRHHLRQISGNGGPDYEVNVTLSPS
ncbi:hypothetical protein ABZU75_12580 [Streptosporangium sp. NPDC005286]|uniref:hypothetical protein n=1 Tax=Streptosporangium sp. NPDC005286 TaxID=3154463 RepID=UPI0033B665D1